MKETVKRIVAVFLLVLTLSSIALPVSAQAATTQDLPIVHVPGKRKKIYDKNNKVVFPQPVDAMDTLDDYKSEIVSASAAGIATGDWTNLGDVISDVLEPSYGPLLLDENGEISNGTYTKGYGAPKTKTSGFVISDYVFDYDWRLDPIQIADDLNDYINQVLKATGKKKVQLVARCLGTSIAAAYLTKYGSSKVDTCVLYASACNGILPMGAFFSGRLNLNPTDLKRYVDSTKSSSELYGIMETLSKVMNMSKLTSSVIQANFSTAIKQILPDLLLETYATMPGHWSMVGDEYYEESKAFIFAGRETKYKKLIEKIDNYHYNVQVKLPETLKNLKKGGMKIAIIAKYNVLFSPLYENCDLQSDDTIEVSNMGFGATCATFNEGMLSNSYIEQVKDFGLENYISKDKIIDSSTCLFPEYTWFVKNCPHSVWPTKIYDFILKIVQSKEQYTINTNPSYPQYLEYDSKTKAVTPVTGVKKNDPNNFISSVKLDQSIYTYTGKTITPNVTITAEGGAILKKGTDYTVKYSGGRKNIGSYTATVTFKGKYSQYDAQVLKFDIVPLNVGTVDATVSTTSVSLNWKAISGVDGYRIYKYNASTNKYTLLGETSDTSYRVKSLSSGTSYIFSVKGYKKFGNTTYVSKSYSSAKLATKPLSPTVKYSSTSSSVTLSWNKVSGATGYDIYVSSKKDSGYKKIGTTTSRSFKYSGMTAGKIYYFRIKAYKKAYDQKFSSSSTTIKTVTEPSKPTLSYSVSTTSVKISWNKVSGATGYQVYMATSENGTYTKLATTSSNTTSYTKKGLKAGTYYYFKVRAMKDVDTTRAYGSFSKLKTATKPLAVKNLKASAAKKSVNLSWTKASPCSGYAIYISEKETSDYKLLTTTKNANYTVSSLKSGKTYYFKIRAYRLVDGNKIYSSYSSPVKTKVK